MVALFEPEMGFAGGRRVPKARPDAQKHRQRCVQRGLRQPLPLVWCITFLLLSRFLIGFLLFVLQINFLINFSTRLHYNTL